MCRRLTPSPKTCRLTVRQWALATRVPDLEGPSALDPLPDDVREHLHEQGWLREDARVPVTAMTHPAWWDATARAYSDWLQTPHLPPGAACSLQHYTGRLLSVVVVTWALTGRLMSLRHEHWHAHVNQRGATLGVRPAHLILGGAATPDQLGTAVAEHVRPMLEGVRTSRLTAPTALGGPAASLAGSFARVHRSVRPAHRPEVAVAGAAALQALDGMAGRPLVTLEVDDVDTGLLQQHRTTCCLIRLGRDHGTCDTCPRLARETRIQQQRARSTPSTPMIWAVIV